MSRSKLCVDIDNVIARTDEVMRQVIREYTHGRVNLAYEDVTDFDYWRCSDANGEHIRREEWGGIHELFSEPERVLAIEPVTAASEGLEQLAGKFEIHFATSRLPKAQAATEEWLRKHRFPHDEVHFVRHGEKHSCLSNAAAAVEDDYEQGVSFAAAGVPCYLLRHPWNARKQGKPGLYWVADWPELVVVLLRRQ